MKHSTANPLPPETPSPPLSCGIRRNVFTAAFTLVELLAVIAVMVMLLAFTMPIIRGGSNMGKAAWDVAGLIEQAQAYAMAQNTYVWVGFNSADVTDATNGTTQLAAFVLASKDGTSSYSDIANLALIDRVHSFDNITLLPLNASGFGATDGYAVPETGTHGAVVPGLGNVVFPTAKLPTKLVSGTKKTLGNGNNSIIQIAPSGSISYPGQDSFQWLNFQLQTMRGAVAMPGDTAIIEVSTLTGRARILRPGDHSVAAAE